VGDRVLSNLPAGAFVGGSWVEVTGPTRSVLDPSNGEMIATLRDSTSDTVDAAVAAARWAFEPWWGLSTAERSRVLEQVADALDAAADDLCLLESVDTGKPLSQARSDVATASHYFRFYAHAAQHLFGDVIPLSVNTLARTVPEPYGVVAHITPWNSPLSQLARGVAPSLAVGNSVVIKPSELAPLSSLAFADLVSGIVPPGVINVVPGDGVGAGAALAGNPGIDHLTFTGSVPTGIAVSIAAARNVVATNLELGGKSAAIVFPDADISAAARTAAAAITRNSGQSCSALTRFIVHRSIRDRFEDLLVDRVSQLRAGPGRDDPDLGPLVSAGQRDRVFGLIEDAAREGGEVRIGGASAPTYLINSGGFWVAPTVITGVRPDMAMANTEVFGPVQTVIEFSEEDEAIDIANGTPYGLTAAVFTSDGRTAERAARRLRAGQVQINGFAGAAVEVPFGGYRHSGHGREKGFAAMLGYTQTKAIVTHLG